MKKQWRKFLGTTLLVTSLIGSLAGCADNVGICSVNSAESSESNTVGSSVNDTVGSAVENTGGSAADNIVDSKNLMETLDKDTALCFDSNIQSYDAVQSFAWELLQQNLEEANPVLSPVSAYLALCMAGNGAREETLAEFYELLGNDLQCTPCELISGLSRETDGMTINLANSAWADEEMIVSQEYLTDIDSYFQAEIYQADLASEQAMKDMNSWISGKTRGLIPSLLEECLDEDVRLVLYNTIYFNGDWRNAFNAYDTLEQEFALEDGKKVTVDMMRILEENQVYLKNDFAEGVKLPYQDENIVFLALKPANGCTVREMYEQLTWEDVEGFLRQEDTVPCNLHLPKFEVTFEKELNDSLKNMGLQKAFDPGLADLSGLGSTLQGGNLYISLVKQKAVIKVDEEGTEAAAVTSVEIRKECAMEYSQPVVDITFDQPFLYMIVDLEKEVPLFMGIMDDPAAEA